MDGQVGVGAPDKQRLVVCGHVSLQRRLQLGLSDTLIWSMKQRRDRVIIECLPEPGPAILLPLCGSSVVIPSIIRVQVGEGGPSLGPSVRNIAGELFLSEAAFPQQALGLRSCAFQVLAEQPLH